MHYAERLLVCFGGFNGHVGRHVDEVDGYYGGFCAAGQLNVDFCLEKELCLLYFSPYILSLCLPLLTHTIIHHSFADDLQLQMSAPLIENKSYFTLCSHAYVMSKLGQLRTCLNLMTTIHNSCLSPLRELSISITYLLLSL